MSDFYDYCVNCGIMFTDREKFLAHKQEHERRRKAAAEQKPISEVEARIAASVHVPSDAVENSGMEKRLAATRAVNAKRKKLIASGIEAATMSQKEVENRYEEEKKNGTVK